MTKCAHGALNTRNHMSAGWRSPGDCVEPVVPNRLFCTRHLAESLARVESGRGEKLRPWPNVLRGSAIGRRYFRGSV